MLGIPRITLPSQIRNPQSANRNFNHQPPSLKIGRWTPNVECSAQNGPVAQRLEQGTHNLAFCPESLTTRSTRCERLRHEPNTKDRHNVNIASTPCVSRNGNNGILNGVWPDC